MHKLLSAPLAQQFKTKVWGGIKNGDLLQRAIRGKINIKREVPFMTAPRWRYIFPDFEPIIDRLVNSRSAIEADREQIMTARPNLTEGDVRLTAFTHLYHTLNSALVSLRFLADYLLPSENEWWEEPRQQALFGSYDQWFREAIANNFNNGFVKYTVMHKLFGDIENSFRQLLRKIDPSVASNATDSIDSVFGALISRIGNKPADSDELLKLLRLSRNTIHNNGVFYPKSQTDAEVVYKGNPYHFTHGKPINFVNWNFLIDRIDDVRQLFTAVILNANIIGISDEILDMFGENRVRVRFTP
jgi:hypothetical protein